MRPRLASVPALPAAIGMLCGILLASLGAALWVVPAGAALFFILYFAKRHWFAFLCMALSAGALLAYASAPAPVPQWACGSRGIFCGKALEVDATASGYWRCVVEVDGIDSLEAKSVPEGLEDVEKWVCVFCLRERPPMLMPGARVSYRGKIEKIELDPAAVPHSDEYVRRLLRSGATAQVFVGDAAALTVERASSPMSQMLWNARGKMHDALCDCGANATTCALLVAVLLGVRDYLSPDLSASFSASGLAHMLALSGLHLGILATLAGFALFPLRAWRHGYVAIALISLILIWLYAAIVGWPASVVRAAVMLSVFLVARLAGRDYNSLNALCVSVVVVLAFDPQSLFAVGFQMSFAAVGSILVFMRALPKTLKAKPWIYFLISLVTIPMAAMLGVGIVSAYYFGTFPTMFLPANIAAGLLAPWILGTGAILMMLGLMGVHAAWLAGIADWLCSLLTAVGRWAGGSGLAVGGISVGTLAVVLYFAALGLAAAALWVGGRKTAKGLPASLLLGIGGFALLAVAVFANAPDDGERQDEAFVPTGYPQGLMVCRGDRAILHALGGSDPGALAAEYEGRFQKYLQRRGCKGIEHAEARQRIVRIAGKTVAIFESDTVACMPEGTKADYAIITAGYHGGVEEIVRACGADTVLLGADISPARARRLASEGEGRVRWLKRRGLRVR